jgi:hypothetical protein
MVNCFKVKILSSKWRRNDDKNIVPQMAKEMIVKLASVLTSNFK